VKNLTRGQRFLVYVYGALFVGMVGLNVAGNTQRDRAIRERDAAIVERNTANAVRDVIANVCKIRFELLVSPPPAS
jgi:hypothetical protein